MNPALQSRIVDALLGKPLVTNAFRGMLVEAMLAEVLEPEWRWCSGDWASYDFEHSDGRGLEVKQSAALQSWHADGAKPSSARFDIAARTGRYEGSKWIAEPGRAAAIYVFAWHPFADFAIADHREPAQWQFFVVPSWALPEQKSIGLAGLRALSGAVAIGDVAAAVAAVPTRHD